jgi:hypothetical protein
MLRNDPAALAAALTNSRERSSRITQDLQGDRLLGPKLAIVNPPLWEIGHVAWFQEHWCLRHRAGGAPGASILPSADALYDSAKVHHDTRWDLPLPDVEATRRYQSDVLGLVLQRLEREPEDASLRYFVQLAIFHEDMHAEAFHYTRQTLGYPDPFRASSTAPARAPADGDLRLAGGSFRLGASPADGFVFDNEKWAHEVDVAPFRISRTAVSNAAYLAFVEAGGYRRREWWSDAGWAWLASAKREAPVYWTKQDGTWLLRRFDKLVALPPGIGPREPRNVRTRAGRCLPAGRHRRRLPPDARQHLGMDRQQLRSLSGLCRRPVQGILGALVRHAQGAARRQLRQHAPAAAQHVAQLLHPRARRHLRGVQDMRQRMSRTCAIG